MVSKTDAGRLRNFANSERLRSPWLVGVQPQRTKRPLIIEHLSQNFWNIRGDFRIAGVLNIGTHMSLVRKEDGTFILIDACEMDPDDRRDLLALTEDGTRIEVVLNVHPFHTVDCEQIHELLPHATLIGTRRHHTLLPDLPWSPEPVEDESTQRQFARTFDFSVPDGVDLVTDDDSVHAGSVLVRHRETGIVHVDDTLLYLDLPSLVEKFGAGPKLRFHPKLSDALQKRAGAADAFASWARALANEWRGTPIVCAAHKGIYHMADTTFRAAIEDALENCTSTLDEHRKQYG